MSGSRRKPGPLGPFVEGYRGWLLERGYAPSVVIRSLGTLGHLGRWMERDALEVDQLSNERVGGFLAEYRRDRGNLPRASVWQARRADGPHRPTPAGLPRPAHAPPWRRRRCRPALPRSPPDPIDPAGPSPKSSPNTSDPTAAGTLVITGHGWSGASAVLCGSVRGGTGPLLRSVHHMQAWRRCTEEPCRPQVSSNSSLPARSSREMRTATPRGPLRGEMVARGGSPRSLTTPFAQAAQLDGCLFAATSSHGR
jgi:hypothetical protein